MAAKKKARMTSDDQQDALGKLRALMALNVKDDFDLIRTSRDQVLARYGPAFSPANIDALTREEFHSFLYLENNRHWSGLNRLGWKACEDIRRLKRELTKLLDESVPIETRFDSAIAAVPGMGKGLLTAILTVSNPDTYGVWNNTSEWGMRQLGVWPKFERGMTVGKRYLAVNNILRGLRNELNIDFWTLDALWWRIDEKRPGPVGEDAVDETEKRFALEKHLQDFLLENWSKTALGKEWNLYSEDGDAESGCEYITDIGRIDFLARHRRAKRWLVIELKRDQSSDQTVGQILRYIGWVKENLAKKGEKVDGLIISHKSDVALKYALLGAYGISIKQYFYEVEFHLRTSAPIE